MNVRFNLENGDVYVEATKIQLDSDGKLPSLPSLIACRALQVDMHTVVWRFSQKFETLSCAGDLVVRATHGKLSKICFLFDEIVFFGRSIKESKIVDRFERKYRVSVESPHPTIGEFGPYLWGTGRFLYDPKQGDLSLCFKYD